MRRKKIIGLLLFLFMLIISTKLYATSQFIDVKDSITLNVGETYTYDVGAFVNSTKIKDESIISYEKDGNHKRKITALSEGETTINFNYFNGATTLTVKVIDPALEAARAEEKRLEELKNAYKKAEPGKNDNYSDVAKWVYSDNTYNESKQLKKLAGTDEGLEKLKAWRTEIGKHVRGGTNDTTPEYLAQTILNDLISANKDPDKINDAAGKNKDHGNNVEKTILAKMNSAAGEDRNNRDVFNDDVLKDISKYDPSQNPMDNNSSNRIETATSKILTVISNVGMAVAVIMLAILGIKYMLGSVEEKAEYKEGLIPYVIGAFILFGITSFVKILMAIGNQIGNLS